MNGIENGTDDLFGKAQRLSFFLMTHFVYMCVYMTENITEGLDQDTFAGMKTKTEYANVSIFVSPDKYLSV